MTTSTKPLSDMVVTSLLSNTNPTTREQTKNTQIYAFKDIQGAIQGHFFILLQSNNQIQSKKLEIVTSFYGNVAQTTVEGVNGKNYQSIAKKASEVIVKELKLLDSFLVI